MDVVCVFNHVMCYRCSVGLQVVGMLLVVTKWASTRETTKRGQGIRKISRVFMFYFKILLFQDQFWSKANSQVYYCHTLGIAYIEVCLNNNYHLIIS